jgi:mono/diheme cytochrome c family protein/plastocyanin
MNSLRLKSEWVALGVIVLLLTAVVAIPALGWLLQPQTLLLHARMAETGGWTPENLTAEVGKPLYLRLTSDDVLHSFAVGQSDQPPVDIKPGEISQVTLTFSKPGKYVYYCTRWCSINHWRMRGVIQVSSSAAETAPEKPPLYVSLGLDIDAEHHADVPLPRQKPVASPAGKLGIVIPGKLTGRDYYLTHTPADAYKTLKAQPDMAHLPDQDLWNLVALAWKANISSQSLESGRKLYATNCAACHGEQGAGDGVFAAELSKAGEKDHSPMTQGEMTQPPGDFTQPEHMLAASPAHLQGKIIRGGMGTGMPYWGPIFTEQQTWDLVAYIWSFQFDFK